MNTYRPSHVAVWIKTDEFCQVWISDVNPTNAKKLF